jgi:hypothetical protein
LITVSAGGAGRVIDVASGTTDSSLTASGQLRNRDVAAIDAFDGQGTIRGAVTVSSVVESVPLFERATLTADERTDIYNKIFVSETAALQFVGNTVTAPAGTANEGPSRTGDIRTFTVETTAVTEDGSVEPAQSIVLVDSGAGVESGSIIRSAVATARDLAIIYSDGVVSIANTTSATESTLADDTPTVTGVAMERLVESASGATGLLSTLLPTILGAVDSGIATEGGEQTSTVSVDIAHTAFATPFVSKTVDSVFFETETADGVGSARFSNPFDPDVGDRGSAVNSAQLLFRGVDDLTPEAIATEDNLRAFQGNSSELFGETTQSVESPTIANLPAYTVADVTAGVDAGGFSQDPLFAVGDRATARFDSSDGPSVVSLDAGLDLAENTAVSPTIATTASVPMHTVAVGIGRENGSVTILFTDSVLEGSGGVQPERVSKIFRSAFTAVGDGFGADTATQTTESPSTTRDEGIAQDTDMGVSESVTLSEEDTGSATDAPSTSGTTTVQLDEYAVAVSVPQTTTTSRTVIVDEFSSISELVSLVAPNTLHVADTTAATDSTSMQTAGIIGTGSIDLARASEAGGVVQANSSSLFGEQTGVVPRPQITRSVENNLIDSSGATEFGDVEATSAVLSPSRIRGLRRILGVLGIEKDYIYNRPIGSRRRAEVNADDDGTIEVGPQLEVELDVPHNRNVIVGPTRDVDVSPADE